VLIKCIAGLLRAEEGSIEVLGENVSKISGRDLAVLRTKIGFLFQSGALYDSMTVRENLEFPLRRIKRQLTKKEITEKTAASLLLKHSLTLVAIQALTR
jgi:phospholipid/cholesterol/gamma-HCH transport system ATP-binding protein